MCRANHCLIQVECDRDNCHSLFHYLYQIVRLSLIWLQMERFYREFLHKQPVKDCAQSFKSKFNLQSDPPNPPLLGPPEW